MFGLKHILHPIKVDDFLENYIGEKSLYISGGPEKFPDLFGWEQVNDQINFSRPSLESVRLIFEKKPLDLGELSRLAEWMVKGATLAINHVQQIDPVISRFATSLGKDMNSPVNINCYASYPSKQGFDNHFDNHDVFVIQTSGSKSWKVFEPTRKYPLDIDTLPKGLPPESAPYLECDLHVGDVLYIPRGHWHYAVAIEPSIHMTVSYSQRSGIDFLHWLIDQLRDNNEFMRRDFPVAMLQLLGGNRPNDSFQNHFDEFRRHITSIVENESLVENFLRFCMVRNPVPRNFQLPELGLIKEQIRAETRFRLSTDQKMLARLNPVNNQGELIVRGHILKLTDVDIEILKILANSVDGSLITGSQLQSVSPETRWDNIKMLLVMLFEHGILELDENELGFQ